MVESRGEIAECGYGNNHASLTWLSVNAEAILGRRLANSLAKDDETSLEAAISPDAGFVSLLFAKE
jgi:hypothetical protein